MVFGTHQRLCRQDIDGAHIMLGGESAKHRDAIKYLGVVLDNSLSFNLHNDYVKKKVSKTLGMSSRIRSSLTTEASHRLYNWWYYQIWNTVVVFFTAVVKEMKKNWNACRVVLLGYC